MLEQRVIAQGLAPRMRLGHRLDAYEWAEAAGGGHWVCQVRRARARARCGGSGGGRGAAGGTRRACRAERRGRVGRMRAGVDRGRARQRARGPASRAARPLPCPLAVAATGGARVGRQPRRGAGKAPGAVHRQARAPHHTRHPLRRCGGPARPRPRAAAVRRGRRGCARHRRGAEPLPTMHPGSTLRPACGSTILHSGQGHAPTARAPCNHLSRAARARSPNPLPQTLQAA